MKLLTPTEAKVLLLLFKEFNIDYNANTIAKRLNITRRGALKIVKHLHKQELLINRKYGNAVFYKINLQQEYTKQLLKVLLMNQAKQKASRWLYQYHKFFHDTTALILFGSIIHNERKANDIDLIIVTSTQKINQVQELITSENRIALKPIHPIWQHPSDLIKNLQKPDPVLLNALKLGYILHGYDFIIETVHKAQQTYGHFAVPNPEARL